MLASFYSLDNTNTYLTGAGLWRALLCRVDQLMKRPACDTHIYEIVSQANGVQHGGVDGGGDAAEDQLVATGVPAWSDARNSAASITSTARRAQHLPTQHVVRLCHGLRLLGAHGHHGAAQ